MEMASFSTEENPLEADEVCFLGALSTLVVWIYNVRTKRKNYVLLHFSCGLFRF